MYFYNGISSEVILFLSKSCPKYILSDMYPIPILSVSYFNPICIQILSKSLLSVQMILPLTSTLPLYYSIVGQSFPVLRLWPYHILPCYVMKSQVGVLSDTIIAYQFGIETDLTFAKLVKKTIQSIFNTHKVNFSHLNQIVTYYLLLY